MKLTLKKETLMVLSADQLDTVNGGTVRDVVTYLAGKVVDKVIDHFNQDNGGPDPIYVFGA